MGINIPTRDELIANRLNLQQLAEFIGMKFFSVFCCAVRMHLHSAVSQAAQ